MKKSFKDWAIDVGIRCIKTMAQAGIAYIGAATIFSQVNWAECASVVGMAAVLCVLTNIASFERNEIDG